MRAQYHIPVYQLPPDNVTPGSEDDVVVTITQAERMLGVSKVTLYRWLRDGFITDEQLTPGAPWQIRIDQPSATRSDLTSPTAGCPWTRPPKPSA